MFVLWDAPKCMGKLFVICCVWFHILMDTICACLNVNQSEQWMMNEMQLTKTVTFLDCMFTGKII